MSRKPKDLRDPWALAFAGAIYTWLDEQGMDAAELAISLDIPLDRWYHAVSANTITRPEYYARVFYFTGLPQADPRYIPPRRIGSGLLRRAWSEDEWRTWKLENKSKYSIQAVQSRRAFKAPTKIGDPVSHLIETLATTLQSILDSDETSKSVELFIQKYGPELGQLYSIISVFRIEKESDRKMAIHAHRRYR